MKTNFLKLSVLATLLVVTSCSVQEVETNPQEIDLGDKSEQALANVFNGKSPESDCNFEYEGKEGPEFWSSLCSGEWEDCAGNVQSPIDIITSSVVEDGGINNININYEESQVSIINNGHTIQFNYDGGSSADLNNIDYDLLQFHFHTGSEHTIDGKRYPMEMHLVHQDPVTKLLAVIGIFFEEGEEQEVLKEHMGKLPKYKGDSYSGKSTFKVEELLPDDMEFYTYSGSLTTPACSEIVTWYVVKEPITASAEQLASFQEIMHENYRPTQELNGRIIRTKD